MFVFNIPTIYNNLKSFIKYVVSLLTDKIVLEYSQLNCYIVILTGNNK